MTIKITTKPQIGSQIADIMDEAVAFGAPDDWSFSNDGSVTFSAKSLAAMIRWAASEGAQGQRSEAASDVATNIAAMIEKVTDAIMTTKEIPSTVLLSLAAGGLGLPGVSFSALHEAIEHLLGEPVWTHQLASPEPWSLAREAVIAQHPAFANVDGDALRAACEGQTREDATIRANAWADAELAAIGASSFVVAKGDGRDPSVVVVLAPSAGTN